MIATAPLYGLFKDGQLEQIRGQDAGDRPIDVSTLSRKKIAIGIVGQSMETEHLPANKRALYPRAYVSQRNPAVRVPMPYTSRGKRGEGSSWPAMYDNLFDWGYDAEIICGAYGGLSFVNQVCAKVKAWGANTEYFAQRTEPLNNMDWGYSGDLMVSSNRVFLCTQGKSLATDYAPGVFDPVDSMGNEAGYVWSWGTGTSGGTIPAAFATAVKGQIIVDGSVTWKCIDAANVFNFYPGMLINDDLNNYGFDPLGVLAKMHAAMINVRAEEKIIILCNGQSDLSSSVAEYQATLTAMVRWLRYFGYRVGVGLSSFTQGGSVPAWTNLQTARQNTLDAFAADPMVFPAANLFAELGTEPVGGWYDTVHLDGPAVIAAGEAHGNAIRQVLPKLVN